MPFDEVILHTDDDNVNGYSFLLQEQFVDVKERQVAIDLIERLPPDFSRRLIRICAERLGIKDNDLPDIATLRRALDKPALPASAARCAAAVNGYGGKRLHHKLGAWLDAEADALAEWHSRYTAWTEVERHHGLAAKAAAVAGEIARYVGNTPYLEMIHYGDKEVRERADADAALALKVVRDLPVTIPIGERRRKAGKPAPAKRRTEAEFEELRAKLKGGINEDRIRELAGGDARLAERFVRETTAMIDRMVDLERDTPPIDPTRSAHDISEECGGANLLRKPPTEGDLAYVLSWGLDINDIGKEGYESRLFAPAWHRRRIRKHVRRTREHVAYILHIVSDRGEKCVSDVALNDRRGQLKKQREWGESHEVVSPSGERTAMSLLMQSTREALLARTWAVVLGMQEEARLRGLTPMWISLTTPSEFHPAPKIGQNRWDPTLTPKDAREWLQERWENVRSWLVKDGIKPFGIWVVEPHGDGCPHVHMLLWVEPARKADLTMHFRRYWPTEIGAKIVEKEDSATRQVAYYVWAYLSPALKRTGDDGAGEEIKGKGGETSERYDAHAATWGYRRYGFFGLASGTLTAWQKVYKAKELPEGTPFAHAKAHMDEMDWHGALCSLGAFGRNKPRRRLEIFAKVREFSTEYVADIDGYGDEVKRLAGVTDGWTSLLCRSGCTIQPILRDETEDEVDPSVTLVVIDPRGAAAPPALAGTEGLVGPPG